MFYIVYLFMSKIALITGILGQDGSYLAEFLLEKRYKVHGIVRQKNYNDENILLMDITQISETLDTNEDPPVKRVVIRLFPEVAPKHVSQIKTLSKII